MKTRILLAVAWGLLILPAPAAADAISIGALGDSLTDPYVRYTGSLNPETGMPFWGAAGDKNWAEQFKCNRGDRLAVQNFARAGVTSHEMLAQWQHEGVADRVRSGQVRNAVLMVGANDMFLALRSDASPELFIANLAANLQTAVSTIRSAGQVGLVVGNIPNLTVAPAMQAMFGGDAASLAMARDMVQAANREIARVAAANGLPLVDLYKLSDLALQPPTLAGTPLRTADFFAPDQMHPSTVGQGLIANTILEALARGYGVDVSTLRLTNEEILRAARLPYQLDTAEMYYDVSGYVVPPEPHHAPEPSTLVLCVAAGVVGLARLGYRRRRAA